MVGAHRSPEISSAEFLDRTRYEQERQMDVSRPTATVRAKVAAIELKGKRFRRIAPEHQRSYAPLPTNLTYWATHPTTTWAAPILDLRSSKKVSIAPL